jgi:hypothetical protein
MFLQIENRLKNRLNGENNHFIKFDNFFILSLFSSSDG